MRTIARNSRRAKEIFDKATLCTSHTLDNGFKGRECDKKHAWAAMQHPIYKAKLRPYKPGVYTVHVHGNFWYAIHSPVI